VLDEDAAFSLRRRKAILDTGTAVTRLFLRDKKGWVTNIAEALS